MSPCASIRQVSVELDQFIANVKDVKEESITDYLVWRWREADRRFNFLNVETFTREEENKKTGADFELELWLVNRTFNIKLLFQAKKAFRQNDAYRTKLNYPNKTQAQLKKLIAYAHAKGSRPFYIFYTAATPSAGSMCGQHSGNDATLFIASASRVKELADGIHGSAISKSDILRLCTPFHCMLCCPLVGRREYFAHYFRESEDDFDVRASGEQPRYVSMLLSRDDQSLPREEMIAEIYRHGLDRIRNIGVIDLRD